MPSYPEGSKERDARFMGLAIDLARKAEQAGEVPIGAILIDGDEVIGEGFNNQIGTCDPTSHAEIVALRDAAQRRGNYRLSGAELFVTLEPCAMCAGAMIHARISRLVFGAEDPKSGAAGSMYSIPTDPRLNHRIAVVAGVLAADCATFLRRFFENRR